MLTNSKIHNKSNLEVSGRGWDLDGKKLIKPVLGGEIEERKERREGRIRRKGDMQAGSTHSRTEVKYKRHIEETMLEQVVYIRQCFSK